MYPEDKIRQLEEDNRQLLLEADSLQTRLGRLEAARVTMGRWVYLLLAFVIVSAVLLSMYPLTLEYAQHVYDPTKIPQDYGKVISYLKRQGGETRVLWLPLFGGGLEYDWVGGKRIGPFDVWTSNPGLNDYLLVPDSYGYWLERELYQKAFVPVALMKRETILSTNLGARLLTPFNARYMVLDQSVKGYDFGDRFDKDTSLTLVYQAEKLKVYRVDEGHGLIWPASRAVAAESYFDDLCLYQRLSKDALAKTCIINGSTGLKGPNSPIAVKDYATPLVYNGDFQVPLVDGMVPGWLPARLDRSYTVSYSRSSPRSKKQSLKVVNTSPDTWALGWVAGTEIPARPGLMYCFSCRVKYTNSIWTHAAVEGYNEAEQKWEQLLQCPSVMSGNSGWKTWNSSFVLPAGYTKLRPMLAGGWVQDTTQGRATSWFDDVNISQVSELMFRKIVDSPAPPEVTFDKVSPEKYIAHVRNATAPFILVFGEYYDTLWVARMPDGRTINPVQMYGYINAFPMNKKGSFDVTIEYLPQAWYQSGLVISIVVILLCAVVLVLIPVRSRATARKGLAAAGSGPRSALAEGVAAISDVLAVPPESSRMQRVAEHPGERAWWQRAPRPAKKRRPPAFERFRAWAHDKRLRTSASIGASGGWSGLARRAGRKARSVFLEDRPDGEDESSRDQR